MNKEEIKNRLQDEILASAKLPTQIDFRIENDCLYLTVKGTGVKANMQKDESAFEGWAVVIKSAFPEIKEVVLDWETPVYNAGKEKAQEAHYNRFVMRAYNFEKGYNWFHIADCHKAEVDEMRKHLNKETPLVVNYPKRKCGEVTDESKKPEAVLERKLVKLWQKECPITDEQLPVGLFKDGAVAKKNTFTPGRGSQIDIWQLKDNTIRIHELKAEGNDKVGIISELMFYVCTIKNMVDSLIVYPETISKTKESYRHFKEFANAVKNKKITNVIGSFTTSSLHPLIEKLKPSIVEILNDNNFGIIYEFNDISRLIRKLK